MPPKELTDYEAELIVRQIVKSAMHLKYMVKPNDGVIEHFKYLATIAYRLAQETEQEPDNEA